MAIYLRADGIRVQLDITNAVPSGDPANPTIYLAPAFEIPDSQLVAVVTAAEIITLVGR